MPVLCLYLPPKVKFHDAKDNNKYQVSFLGEIVWLCYHYSINLVTLSWEN